MIRSHKLESIALGMAVMLGGAPWGTASENHPQKPFAQFVDIPSKGQWVITPWYVYTVFKDYWQGTDKIDIRRGDLEYDYAINDGMVLIEYGIFKDWALDLNVGYVSAATRAFDLNGNVEKTSGLMDFQFGIRCHALKDTPRSYLPDLTLRVGGLAQGTYDRDFPLAPGYGETGIEPAIYTRKRLWALGTRYTGGVYGHGAYRHMISFAPDQVIASIGVFQNIKRFSLGLGYRHHQALSGPDIAPLAYPEIHYSNRVREINNQVEWGGSYTTPGGIRFQFYMWMNFDGRNTGDKLIYGLYASFPIGGKD